MKAFFNLLFGMLFLGQPLMAQDTFHKLVSFEFPVTRFTSVLPTDSCYYATGTFTDSISPVRTGVLLAKLDGQGNLLSLNTIKHPDRLYFNDFDDLQFNNQGNLFTVGWVDPLTENSSTILYIYNTDGDTLLTRSFKSILYPDLNPHLPSQIIQTNENGYAILIEHKANEAVPDADISLLVIDSTYNIKSYLAYGSTPLHESPRSIIQDENGGFIIGAKRTNRGQVQSGFISRTLIIETDSFGDVVWEYLSPGGILQERADAMVKTADDGLVVASGRGIEVEINSTSSTIEWNALVFKLDGNQNVVWNRLIRGFVPTTSTRLVEMVEAPDASGYVVSGIVADNVSGPEPRMGTWLVKISPEGDSLWARYYTYFDEDFLGVEPYDLRATPDSGYVVVGFARSAGLPAPAWIMKVDRYGCLIPDCHLNDDTTSVSDETIPTFELSIYPNPTSDFLNFQLKSFSHLQHATIRILDVTGRMVKEFHSHNPPATHIVPVYDWPQGIYFLQYLDLRGGLITSEKFIVSH